MALFLFTKAILAGEPIDVFNRGEMMRDFTFVKDIVQGIYGVMNNIPSGSDKFDPKDPDPSISSAPYRLYNIGNNAPVQLMDFVKAIEDKLGKKAQLNLLPMQPGDVSETYADTTTLLEQTGYKPNTSIQDGINSFIDWYNEFYG